MLKFTSTSFRE